MGILFKSNTTGHWTQDQPRLHVMSGGNNIVMLAKEALAFLLFMFANLVLAMALSVEFVP